MPIEDRGPADVRGPRRLKAQADAASETIYLRPLGLVSGPAAITLCDGGQALALAGGPFAFTHAELIRRGGAGAAQRTTRAVRELAEWAGDAAAPGAAAVAGWLERLCRPRPPYGGHQLSGPAWRPLVMGVVNVTPDSFSDGGVHADAPSAIAHGRMLHRAGADIIDVGGESTRPGAQPVPVDVERARVLPVIEALAGDGVTVSVDTRRAAVMRAALAAGAQVVNDVSALRDDPDALGVVADSDASVVLMHMSGAPATMQRAPRYDDVVLEVYDSLAERVAAGERAGIAPARICVDPGIGFGKTVSHNLALIASLALFQGLGCTVGIGVSRKSFIDAVAGPAAAEQRLPGSLAAMLRSLDQGAQLVRVHDVAESVQAITLWQRLHLAGESDTSRQ